MKSKFSLTKLVKILSGFYSHFSLYLIFFSVSFLVWLIFFADTNHAVPLWWLYLMAVWTVVLILHFIFSWQKLRLRKKNS